MVHIKGGTLSSKKVLQIVTPTNDIHFGLGLNQKVLPEVVGESQAVTGGRVNIGQFVVAL
jgi:hypothetical protein